MCITKYLLKDSIQLYLLYFSIIFYIYNPFLRAFVYDTIYFNLIPPILIYMVGALNLKDISSFFYQNKILIFFFSYLLFCFGCFIFFNEHNNFYSDLFYYYIIPSIILPLSLIMRRLFFVDEIHKLFIFIFIFESSFMILEVLDNLVSYNFHKSHYFDWIMSLHKGRFEIIGGGWDSHNQGVFNIYDHLPLILGVRGWPHYSVMLYLISFVFVIYNLYEKKMSNIFVTLPILLTGISLIFLLQIKTHILTLAMSLLLLCIFLNKKIFRDLTIIGIIGVLIIYITNYGQSIINKMSLQFMPQRAWLPEEQKWEIQPGRLEHILNLKQYLFIFDIPIKNLLFGFGHIPNHLEKSANYEIHLFVQIIKNGLIYTTFFLIISIVTLVFIFLNYKISKNLNILLFCAISILLLDTLHFGFTFNNPNNLIYYLLITMTYFVNERKIK